MKGQNIGSTEDCETENTGRDSSICIIGVREGENKTEGGDGGELTKNW